MVLEKHFLNYGKNISFFLTEFESMLKDKHYGAAKSGQNFKLEIASKYFVKTCIFK